MVRPNRPTVISLWAPGRSRAAEAFASIAATRQGALLVADDMGSVVWRVTPQR